MMDYDENEDEKKKRYGNDEDEQEDDVNLARNYNDSEDSDNEEDGEQEDDDEQEDDADSTDNSSGRSNRGQKKNGKKDGGDASDGSEGQSSQEGGQQKGKDLDGDKIKDDLGKESDKLNQPKSEGTGTDSPKTDMGSQAPTTTPESGSMPSTSGGATSGATNAGATTGAEVATAGETAAAGAEGAAATGAATTAGSAAGGAAAGGAASGAAASGAAAVGIGAAAVPIAIIALIILLIILIVGAIAFFVYMPGQVTAKLKSLGVKLLDTIQAKLQGEEDVVKMDEIAEVANYLEKMGYDLKGEGFVSGDIATNITQYDITGKVPDNSYYDPEQTVYRDNDTENITAIYSNPIKTYIVSDNLCYLVKNNNANLEEMVSNHPVYTILAIATTIVAFIVSPVVALGAIFAFVAINGGNPSWGSGLISIYHEEDGQIGKKGDYYRDSERGFIELNAETKQLKVKRGWTNNAYTFDVDGWSGRYGMPLEFLLSIHIATQMPDLAMDIATSFDTDVQVLLHAVDSGQVQAGYHVGPGDSNDSDFVTWEDIMQVVQSEESIASGLWNKLVNWAGNHTSFIDSDELQLFTIQDSEYIKLFQMGLPHAEGGCTCCEHVPNANPGAPCSGVGETDPNSDDFNFDDHTICENCKEQIAWVVAALQKIQDNNWNSYTPYISEVRDHWFRDVFFVIDDISNTDVVLNDEFYFYLTNERWSVYETYKEGDSIPEGFVVGDYKLYNYDSATDTYTLSTKSKAEVDEINEKIANGDTSVSRLVKKATTEKISNIVDAEGNQALSGIDGNKWLAYTTEDTSVNWTKMEMTEDTEEILKKFDGKLYYKESRPDDIKQIEDGQRTATNPKIKKMFVDNTYYQYDGSVAKAKKIEEDRAKYDPKTFNTPDDSRLNNEESKELLGKVSISKDSLTAFSMLENMHTLDADYVYNDFKELIVELNYFDKEELSSKIEKVMTWLLPETGSSGWPVRKYEKGETFYGTLINSKADLALLRGKDILEAKQTLGELDDELDEETLNKILSGSSSSDSTSSTATGSMADFVTKAYDIHKEMEGNNWDYCVMRPEDCDHKYGHACGLNTSIQDAIAGHHNTCCATYVSWVLNEVGYGFVSHGAKSTYDWAEQEGFTPITSYSDLEPGDLLFNKHGYSGNDTSNIGHVQILGNDGEWLNAGSVNAINSAPHAYDADFIIGMRPDLSGGAQLFEGYEPEEPVVAPITGKVVEQGTVQRENVETGEMEDVGFIKIQAIDKYVFNNGEGYTNCKKDDDTFEDKASDDAKQLEGYDYFFDEYQGVLEGFVLYMEGFDITLDETKGLVDGGDTDSSEVTQYKANPVYNMVDDLEEARSYWKEDAKAAALPIVEINGELYVKEGTVIGKTCDDAFALEEDEATLDTEALKPNGNYIRLILRNLEDAIEEDVESYFNITDIYSFSGSAINIQNIDSMNPELASLIEQLAGPLESEYPGIVNILKAISMNESGGGTNPAAGDDPMQAVESTGGNAGDSIGGMENSVKAAINALKSAWDKAKSYGISDLRVVIQAYNFGSGFVDYTNNKGKHSYDKSLVESFSNEQAARHGWSRYGDKDYVDPKIYKYLPDLNV